MLQYGNCQSTLRPPSYLTFDCWLDEPIGLDNAMTLWLSRLFFEGRQDNFRGLSTGGLRSEQWIDELAKLVKHETPVMSLLLQIGGLHLD